jgi:hypothetical protein
MPLAREMAETIRSNGARGADAWLRIIVAIGPLTAPPTNAH